MKRIGQQRMAANMLGVLVLAFIMLSLLGCQALSLRTPSSTLTPIVLGTAEATPQLTKAQTTAITTQNTPTALPAAQTARVSMSEPPPVGTPSASIIALGRRATIVLRARPASTGESVAQVPGSQVLRAQGRNADSSWLWVMFNEAGQHGWVASGDVKLMGDVLSLAETESVSAVVPATSASALKTGTTPSPTRPPMPATPLLGKIVFQTASGGDIYLINADGTGLLRLADGIDPALSPDGTRVAFVRWTAPHGVFILDLRSGEERRLLSANQPRSPAWSPNGEQLAFVHLIGSDVCRDSPFGCLDEATIRARFGGQDCLDTPFGRTCIQDYPVSTVERTGIVLTDMDGAGWLDIAATTDAQAITWRPGNDQILYRGAGGLQIAVPDAASWSLVRDPSLGAPAWSPDGNRLAVQVRLHDRTDLFLLDTSGNRVARLTAPPIGVTLASHNVAPAWSPDGKYLLFLSNRDGAWRLYRMDADGSNQVPFLPIALKDIRFSYDFAAERVVSWSR